MQPLIKSLLWTFVHSLWEGFFAALLVAVIISLTGKAKAKLRYNLLGMLFMMFLAAVSITFIVQYHGATSSVLLTASDVINANTNSLPGTLPAGLIADLTGWLDDNTILLLMAWAFFFVLNCFKLVAGLSAVRRLRHYKTHPVNEEWLIKLDQLRETLGIRQVVGLLQSELIKVPVVLGSLKPMILLPVGLITRIPPEQVEAILLHELGHVRRKDYIVNLFQRFTEAIFFFNPAILWISSLLRQEREACCDDMVVARIGEKRNYLNALVSFQEYAVSHKSYALGISNRRQYLLVRVKRMLTNENKKLNLVEKAALLSGILLFSAFTYITREKDPDPLPVVTLPVEQFIELPQPKAALAEKLTGGSKIQTTGIIRKKIRQASKPVTDTVPAREDKTSKLVTDQKTLPPAGQRKNSATDADQVLKEIQQIKDQIGVKKESIGKKKDQLKEKEGKDSKEEQALKQQIEKERSEIEGKRAELEKKRAQLGDIKKQDQIEKQQLKEKQQEEKNADKNELKNETKFRTKLEKQQEPKVEPEVAAWKIKAREFEYNYGDKMKVREDDRLFASRKASLFKTGQSKYERQERRFKLEQRKAITSPAAPGNKENLKSPSPPGMKSPPSQ